MPLILGGVESGDPLPCSVRLASSRKIAEVPPCAMHAFGIYIPSKAKIGKGFTIHNFSGIFISEGEMGENVIVFQGVTIGHLRGQPAPPKIGNNVLIAAGAKVLGSVTIGNNVVIGANSVVINDVPDNCTVMGNPARIISRETNWMSEKLAGKDDNY